MANSRLFTTILIFCLYPVLIYLNLEVNLNVNLIFQ